MKSILVSARKPKTDPTPTFPALFEDTQTGDIAFANSSVCGVIVHSTGRPDSWPLGHVFDDDTRRWARPRWTRLTEPVTIEFQP